MSKKKNNAAQTEINVDPLIEAEDKAAEVVETKLGSRETWKKNFAPQFKPGQSGNPKGKPKGAISTKTILRRWLLETTEKRKNPISGDEEVFTQLDLLVLSQLKQARAGNVNSFNALMDRLEGKPLQNIKQESVKRIIARVVPRHQIEEDDLSDEDLNEDDDDQ